MLNWENRPIEIANLINPAFCSLLLHSSVGDFSREKKTGMPYALLFLVLPLTLHEPTRTSLPNDTRISLAEWFKEQPEEFGYTFVCQTRQLIPYTREAFMFGMQRGLFDTDENGNVIAKTGKLNHAEEMNMRGCFVAQLTTLGINCDKNTRPLMVLGLQVACCSPCHHSFCGAVW